MRKALPLLLSLLLALCLLPAPSLADISREQAEEKALAYLFSEAGLGPEDLEPYEAFRNSGNAGWSVAFIPKVMPEHLNGAYFLIMDREGALLHMTKPSELSYAQRLSQDVLKLGPGMFTTQQLLALKEKWAPRLSDLLKEEGEQQKKHNLYVSIAQALNQHIRPPESGDLSQEEALDKAREAIQTTPPWSQEKLSHYLPYAAVRYDSLLWNQPAWYLVFSLEQASSDRFMRREEGYYEKAYLLPLARLFSGAENVPNYVCLCLDARTGAPLGEVYTEYPQGRTVAPFFHMN